MVSGIARDSWRDLKDRFQVADTSLSADDIRALYYMTPERPVYNPARLMEIEARIHQASSEGNFVYALELSDSLLNVYPVSLVALFEKAYSAARLGRSAEERIAAIQYKALLRSLTGERNGKTFASAIPVINQNDEYEIARFLSFLPVGASIQPYNGKVYNIWALKKNKEKQKELYFDISVPAKLIERNQVELLREK